MLRGIGLAAIGVLIIAASVAGAFFVTLNPTDAQTVEFGWDIPEFNATYDVQENGDIAITERISVDFRSLSKHGIYRDLVILQDCDPDNAEDAPCPGGSRRKYHVDDVRAEDQAGRTIQVERQDKKDVVRLRLGDPDAFAPSKLTYVITYTLRGALNESGGATELYWNVTGDRWVVPILETNIAVTLPEDVEIDATCYEGPTGSTAQCLADSTPGGATFRSDSTLPTGDQVTILARWEQGVVAVPAIETTDIQTFSDFFTFSIVEFLISGALSILLMGGVVWTFWQKGRDRQFTSIYYLTQDKTEEVEPLFDDDRIVVEYLPPDDLRPAEMGALLNEGARTRDVSATVVDLAVRGYLKITELEKKRGAKDWTFTKMKEADDRLQPFERNLYDAIFKGGREEVNVSALKDKFATDLKGVQKAIMAAMNHRHWFRMDPSHARAQWAVLGFVIVVVGSALAFFLGLLARHYFIGLPVAIAGVLLLAFSANMPSRTAIGSEAYRRVLGFRLYVSTAETRMQEFNEDQNIFARYLPYAMVFDCVDKWAKAFKDLDKNPDAAGVSTWYAGGGLAGFSAASFANDMQGFSSSVGSTFASTPSSSGGSGGGGGFSGGGGGGGGGGSW